MPPRPPVARVPSCGAGPGIRAAWSTPIIAAAANRVLGVFQAIHVHERD
jgi:hypothetical protein